MRCDYLLSSHASGWTAFVLQDWGKFAILIERSMLSLTQGIACSVFMVPLMQKSSRCQEEIIDGMSVRTSSAIARVLYVHSTDAENP